MGRRAAIAHTGTVLVERLGHFVSAWPHRQLPTQKGIRVSTRPDAGWSHAAAARRVPTIRRFESWPNWPAAYRALRHRLPASTVTSLGYTFRFAAGWHDGQVRPGGWPYTRHLLETLEIVVASGVPDSVRGVSILSAALLHDVVEGTECTLDHIRRHAGQRTASYVDWLTQAAPDGQDAATARTTYLARFTSVAPEVLTIKLADRYSNIQRLHAHPDRATRRSFYTETVTWFLPLAERIPFYAGLYTIWADEYRYLVGDEERQAVGGK